MKTFKESGDSQATERWTAVNDRRPGVSALFVRKEHRRRCECRAGNGTTITCVIILNDITQFVLFQRFQDILVS